MKSKLIPVNLENCEHHIDKKYYRLPDSLQVKHISKDDR